VVVNRGIYTQNLESRENTNPDAKQSEQAAIDEGVLETLDRANPSVETTNYGTLLDEYESTLEGYTTSIKRDAGANGDTWTSGSSTTPGASGSARRIRHGA